MSHIVFLLGTFTPESDANTICANNVMNYLQSLGHEITCICGTRGKSCSEKCDGMSVYRIHHISYAQKLAEIKTPVANIFCRAFHYLHSVLVMCIFPDTEPFFSLSLLKKLKKVNSQKKIDCVVGVFRPFSTLKAMLLYKRRHKKIIAIGYYLDLLKGAIKPIGVPSSIYDKICDRREATVFRNIDLILMAEYGKKYYTENPYYEVYNINYVNFPTLNISANIKGNMVYTNKNKLVYAGYMDKCYRNPMFIMKVVVCISRMEPNIELHLFGTSDMKDEIIAYAHKYPKTIFYHGKVDKETANNAIREANCLVNIGNSIPGIVPSKIFELFSTKKPIVHCTEPDFDSSMGYFEKYPLACIIQNNSDINQAAYRIIDFMHEQHEKISDKYLIDAYYSATPMAVGGMINKALESKR